MAILDDTVVYWNFNEASGNLLDQVGSVDGTTSNITYGAGGKIGDAYSFNGSNSGITVSHNTALNLGGTVKTYWFWLYPTSATEGSLFTKGNAGNNPIQVVVFNSDRTIRTHIEGTGDQTPIMTSASAIPLNEWSFIVLAYDLTSKTVDFYINGSLDVQRTYTTNVGAVNPTQEMFIGTNNIGGQRFAGRMDEWGIADALFGAAEVTELWNSGAGKTHPFSVATTRLIKIAGSFEAKPIKTKVGGTFVDKPIKIKVGGTFQDA